MADREVKRCRDGHAGLLQEEGRLCGGRKKVSAVKNAQRQRTRLTYPMKALPHKFWIIHTPQAISVRRRSTPLKQSTYAVPAETLFSNSLVWIIMASVLSWRVHPRLCQCCCTVCGETSRRTSSSSVALENKRPIVRRACSVLPLRTSHHGDSGAKIIPVMSGSGQTH